MTITRLRADWILGLGVFGAWAACGAAQELSLPRGADLSFAVVHDPGVYALPVGPWAGDTLPVTAIEGRISLEAWRLPGQSQTAFQIVQPLRDALVKAGFDIVLDCAARDCGGFDFRLATFVLPAPEMFVDLTEFHFVSARSEAGGVSLLASRDDARGYLQIIWAGGALGDTKTDAAPAPVATAGQAGTVSEQLELYGHVVLRDLVFQTGSYTLGSERVASLDKLAAYLQANPERRVLFVGHTDATGSLAANRRVSLRRAQAAVAYLKERHEIADTQIAAEGAGFMAPLASNLSEEGRNANRRVEAVLLPLD